MKNIKQVLKSISHISAKLCIGLALACVMIFSIYTAAIWIDWDFNPHFMQIESCYDHGGIWNKAQKICEN
jgi:hypothetical protein